MRGLKEMNPFAVIVAVISILFLVTPYVISLLEGSRVFLGQIIK